MKQYKLTETHPTIIKLRKVEDLMIELKLEVEFNSYGEICINDINTGKQYRYKNIEDDNPECFPSSYDNELIFYKDE